MGKNRKVLNATEVSKGNIKFKSKSEGTMYELLLASGLPFEYAPSPIVLLEGFYPRAWLCGQKMREDKVRAITYTPDFVLQIEDYTVIIEVKGFITDRYPLKRKMLLKIIQDKFEECGDKYLFFEVHSKKDMLFCIDKLKSLKNEHTNTKN